MWPFQHLPIRRFRQSLSGISPASNRFGLIQWVLSRPLYRFGRFDLKHVAVGQRAQALRIQIGQWSPFANTGQYVVWTQEHALVWAWDADRLAAELATQKLNARYTRVIPESLLQPAALSGARLVACLDGVEGQVWRELHLVHSRWWPNPPNVGDWANFLRDGGISIDGFSTVPQVQQLKLLLHPWAKAVEVGKLGVQTIPHEAWIVGAASAMLLVATISQSVELIKTRQATKILKLKLEESARSANPLLLARAKALDARTRIESLQATNLYPPQLTLLAEVANSLPKNGAYLNEWDFQNGRLKLSVVTLEKLSSSFLVKTLQEAGWFRNVQAGQSGDANTLSLIMEALPLTDITLPTRGADATTNDAGRTSDAPKSSPRI